MKKENENKEENLSSFFKPLFWSSKISSINPQKDIKEVVIATINYGN